MIITQLLNILITFIYCWIIIIRGGGYGDKCVWVANFFLVRRDVISLAESSG